MTEIARETHGNGPRSDEHSLSVSALIRDAERASKALRATGVAISDLHTKEDA